MNRSHFSRPVVRQCLLGAPEQDIFFLMDYGFAGSSCSGAKRHPVDLYAIDYCRFELNHHISLAMRSSEREARLDEGIALFTQNERILPSRWYTERLYQRRSWIPERQP
jgi:hypothetical protein